MIPDLVGILNLEGHIAAQVQGMQAVGVTYQACQVAPRWQVEAGSSSCRGVQLQQWCHHLTACSAP